MRELLLAFALLLPLQAAAQDGGGFFGGLAEGIDAARRQRLEQRALEIDARYGTNYYGWIAGEHRLEEIERRQREQAESLRRLNWERWERLYGAKPRY